MPLLVTDATGNPFAAFATLDQAETVLDTKFLITTRHTAATNDDRYQARTITGEALLALMVGAQPARGRAVA
jgi:hypothetical protein